jgi:hypothetical protein
VVVEAAVVGVRLLEGVRSQAFKLALRVMVARKVTRRSYVRSQYCIFAATCWQLRGLAWCQKCRFGMVNARMALISTGSGDLSVLCRGTFV